MEESLVKVEGSLVNVKERLTAVEQGQREIRGILSAMDGRLVNVEERLIAVEQGQGEMRGILSATE